MYVSHLFSPTYKIGDLVSTIGKSRSLIYLFL